MARASGVRSFPALAVLVISGIWLFSRRWDRSKAEDFWNPRMRAYGA